MPGVKRAVKVNDSAVAVVADTWWRAKKALDALPIVWDEGAGATASSATIAEGLKEGLTASGEPFAGWQEGDALKAIEGAAKKVEAVYGTPFLAHATMEPMNCTARVTADRVEVWGPTQNAEASSPRLPRKPGCPWKRPRCTSAISAAVSAAAAGRRTTPGRPSPSRSSSPVSR